MTTRPSGYRRLLLLTVLLALTVVVLGAYTRLTDAGLGCPDWPGCYGHIGVPDQPEEVAAANASFPERPVEAHKAWNEMVHRYFAGTLGLAILLIAVYAWRTRHRDRRDVVVPSLLLGLVIFQALLGMWTVTLQLKPVVVMAHLLGGFTTLALLWWLYLRESGLGMAGGGSPGGGHRTLALVSLAVIYAQVALGGWTSANYAALACTDFPTCQSVWWPPMDFEEAFVLWRGLGVNYEFGVLDSAARTAIHMSHRIGAVVTTVWLVLVGVYFMSSGWSSGARRAGLALLALLTVQVSLGIANVVAALPLAVAVAHNAVGALLLLAIVTLNHVSHPRTASVKPAGVASLEPVG